MTRKTNSNQVSSKEAIEFIYKLLISTGVNDEIAKLTADGLVHTSLRGVDTHGMRLLPHYVEGIEGGRINPTPEFSFEQTSDSTGIFDADHTLGYAAGMKAMQHAIAIAKKAGSGFVSVKNSSHCGALSYYGIEAANNDMIGLGFTHATSRMMAPGSYEEFFGTNPMCIAAPMQDEEPFCYDSAPTAVPFHKILHHRELDQTLPDNVAADVNGNVTTDPHLATQLLPIGGYKGFGLSMIADIFSGLLSGMPVGREVTKMYGDMSEKRRLGQFFGAISIESFQEVSFFKKRLALLSKAIRMLPLQSSDSVNYAPGDKEKLIVKERLLAGIPLSSPELDKLNNLAEKYNIEKIIILN